MRVNFLEQVCTELLYYCPTGDGSILCASQQIKDILSNYFGLYCQYMCSVRGGAIWMTHVDLNLMEQ